MKVTQRIDGADSTKSTGMIGNKFTVEKIRYLLIMTWWPFTGRGLGPAGYETLKATELVVEVVTRHFARSAELILSSIGLNGRTLGPATSGDIRSCPAGQL